METTKKTIQQLRKEYGKNKRIPEKYEMAILTALSHYPEVKDLKITFRLKKRHNVPYGTLPSFKSLIKPPAQREYIITLREQARPPLQQALFRNVPFEAQIGIIGHEIAHVVQYNSCSSLKMIRMILLYMKPSFQRKMERAADILAIVHGLGRQLLTHAEYIRSIPGYLEERRSINRNYLKPGEIREYIRSNDFFETGMILRKPFRQKRRMLKPQRV